jgi:hypothetical protein
MDAQTSWASHGSGWPTAKSCVPAAQASPHFASSPYTCHGRQTVASPPSRKFSVPNDRSPGAEVRSSRR